MSKRYCTYLLSGFMSLSSALYGAATPNQDLNELRPKEHYCPINHQLMEDPVVAEDGRSYERSAITRWFATSNTSPMTGKIVAKILTSNLDLRNLINDWEPSFSDPINVQTITKQLEETIRNYLPELERKARGKNITVFVGETGTGKSTLINILADKRLERDATSGSLKLVDQSNGLTIGQTDRSETKYPDSLESDIGILFDLPGFGDTSGSLQDLINTALTSELLKMAATVKVVYLVGDELFANAGRSNNLVDWHSKAQYFPDSVLRDSTAVLVSQTNTCHGTLEKTDKYISTKVTPRILENREDTPKTIQSKQTLRDIAANERILRSPACDEEYGEKFLQRGNWLAQLKETIKKMKGTKIDKLSMGNAFPEKTRKTLGTLFEQKIKGILEEETKKWPKRSSAINIQQIVSDFIKVVQNDRSISSLKDFAADEFKKTLDIQKELYKKSVENYFEVLKANEEKEAAKEYAREQSTRADRATAVRSANIDGRTQGLFIASGVGAAGFLGTCAAVVGGVIAGPIVAPLALGTWAVSAGGMAGAAINERVSR